MNFFGFNLRKTKHKIDIFLLAEPFKTSFYCPMSHKEGKEAVYFLYITLWSYVIQPFLIQWQLWGMIIFLSTTANWFLLTNRIQTHLVNIIKMKTSPTKIFINIFLGSSRKRISGRAPTGSGWRWNWFRSSCRSVVRSSGRNTNHGVHGWPTGTRFSRAVQKRPPSVKRKI